MSTKQQTAEAFARARSARCHNASTDGSTYALHGHTIARRTGAHTYAFDWCGWYTTTTASHMNAVLHAVGAKERVSYAAARDGKTPSTFTVLGAA
jgi:hypothetical protein